MHQRRGGDAALGRFEHAVHPIAHHRHRHRAELPPVAQEYSARRIAQPEEDAIDGIAGLRASHRVGVTDGDGQGPAGVEGNVGVATDRLTRVDPELRAPLDDEAKGGDVGARQERRLAQRDPQRVVERVDRPRAGERIAELVQSGRLGGSGAQFGDPGRHVERPRAAEEVVRGPAALHPEALHRRIPEAEPHLVAGAFLHLDQRAHRGVMRHRFLRRDRIHQHHID